MTVREEIEQLKKEKNAVILAHYYARPEVQEIADYTGDSFYLSKTAVGLKEQTIVFCGVSFMGESAKVLNPEKTVAHAGTLPRIVPWLIWQMPGQSDGCAIHMKIWLLYVISILRLN